MQLTFYRGIAVPAQNEEAIKTKILLSGLSGTEGMKMLFPDLMAIRQRLDWCRSNPDIDCQVAFAVESNLGICACGTIEGAAYYALEHNASPDTVPLIIKFLIDISEVFVDGRDFLYTALPLWDRDGANGWLQQLEIVRNLFGGPSTQYFEALKLLPPGRSRIHLAKLAAVDPEIVRNHYQNKQIIGGRWKTRFASAFIVRAPISPEQILSVSRPLVEALPKPMITLEKFLSLGTSSQH